MRYLILDLIIFVAVLLASIGVYFVAGLGFAFINFGYSVVFLALYQQKGYK